MKLEPLVLTLSSQVRARLVYVYDAPVFAGAYDMRQKHPALTAWLVRRGEVTVRSPLHQPELKARAGQWLLLPGLPREHHMAEGTRLLSVRFELEQPSGAPWLQPGPVLRLQAARYPKLQTAVRRLMVATNRLWLPSAYHDQFYTPRRQASPEKQMRGLMAWSAAFQHWLEVWLAAVLARGWKLNEGEEDSPLLGRVRAYLAERGFAKPLRLEEVAAACGISVSHLKRTYRDELGLSPARWWNQLRLEEARRRLREEGQTAKQVAYELGFNSPAHFSSWFRQHMTITPRRYQQRGGALHV